MVTLDTPIETQPITQIGTEHVDFGKNELTVYGIAKTESDKTYTPFKLLITDLAAQGVRATAKPDTGTDVIQVWNEPITGIATAIANAYGVGTKTLPERLLAVDATLVAAHLYPPGNITG